MVTLLENVAQVNSDFLSIKNKIVEKGVEVEEGTRTSEYAAKVEQVYEAGKKAEYDAFWNAYLPDNLANWQYIFYSQRWNDDNFYPNKDIKPVGAFTFGFSSHHITNLKQRLIDCGVTLDTSKVTSGNYMFCFAPNITHIPTLSLVGLTEQVRALFDGDKQLVEIEKIILPQKINATFDAWFSNCLALEHITFEGVIGSSINLQWSTKLTQASIRSIFNALSSTTSGLTLTLSRVAKEAAFTTDEWNTLVATKSNWSISLV